MLIYKNIMKKIIILSAIIVFALNAKAQYPSTSEHIYFTGSKTDWVEVTEFTDGIVNDSIRGIVWGGKKFQRKDLNSTIFSAQSVGIRADGTDQTDLINKLLGKTYVSGLIMDVAGGGKITVNGNINAGGRTLYFNGSSISGVMVATRSNWGLLLPRKRCKYLILPSGLIH